MACLIGSIVGIPSPGLRKIVRMTLHSAALWERDQLKFKVKPGRVQDYSRGRRVAEEVEKKDVRELESLRLGDGHDETHVASPSPQALARLVVADQNAFATGSALFRRVH